jgi:hypothetical protein
VCAYHLQGSEFDLHPTLPKGRIFAVTDGNVFVSVVNFINYNLGHKFTHLEGGCATLRKNIYFSSLFLCYKVEGGG